MNDFILLDKEKIIGNKSCSVYKKGIHSNADINVFRCKCSPDEEMIICEECKITCHKDHQGERLTKIKAKDFICSCAKSGHNVNKDINEFNAKQQIDSNNNTKEISCKTKDYFKFFDYNYVFERNSDNAIFCIYCAYFCVENSNTQNRETSVRKLSAIKDDEIPKNIEDEAEDNMEEMEGTDEEMVYYEKILEKKIKQELNKMIINDFKKIQNIDNRVCSCMNDNSHFPPSKNLSNICKVIKKSIFTTLGVNINNFCYKMFDPNCILFKEITIEFMRKNIEINKTIRENTKELEKFQKETYATEFLNISKVVEAVANNFKRANFFINNKITKEFFKVLNIDYLTSLFSITPKENDLFIIIKKQCLRIYRKFYLTPKINSKNFYSDQIDLNITPIHRKLISRNFSTNFAADIGLPKLENLKNLLKVIGENISAYFTDFFTTRFSRQLFKLYAEYLHLLNVIVKYRMDDLEFISTNVLNIYNFLKNLLNNQQQNKIFLIKKQILKLICKFVIKLNDEKFFCYMDFDYKKNKINEKYEKMKFSFENSDLNNMIFKIFLMINQKTYSHKSRDKLFNEQIKQFLDIMMLKHDAFCNNMHNIVKNKKFIIDFENFTYDLNHINDIEEKKILLNLTEKIDLCCDFNIKLYNNQISEDKYTENIINQIDYINSELERLFKEREANNLKDYINIQNVLYANGYTTKMLHILEILRKINTFISPNLFNEVFNSIFKNLLLITKENPFLLLVLVTHKFTKILFYNKPEYNKKLFKFYIKIFKSLKAYSYEIEPTAFFDNFKIHFNKKNIFNVENLEKYHDPQRNEDLYLIGSFLDKLISVCNMKSRPVIFQTLSEQIKEIFSSKLFYNNMIIVLDKLKQDENVEKSPKNDKFMIYIYKNFLKILNHISDGHFVATKSRINNKISNDLVEEFLKIKYIHPNLRRTLIGFYAKSRIQLPYKIFKYGDFNSEVFKGMMETIPIMNKDNKEEFNLDKQKVELETVINELMIFPVNVEKYQDFFLQHHFFKYFAEALFMPCVNSMYKVSYFNEKITSELKYLIYKIFVLFCKCFYFFLNKIDEFKLYNPKFFLDYLCIDVGLAYSLKDGDNYHSHNMNDSISKLKEECDKIKKRLEDDLNDLDRENFLIKDNNILKKFICYLDYYFLKNKIGNNFTNWKTLENENNQAEKINKNSSNEKPHNLKFFSNYMENLSLFIDKYYSLKKDLDRLIYRRIFADEQTYKEVYLPKLNSQMTDFKLRTEFKKSFFLLLFDNIIDFENENVNLSYEYNEKNYIYLKKLVKIFKIDPSFCQSILLEEKNREHSRKILEEMIRKNLTCLFQIVFVEFNTINSNEGKSTYRNILKILEFIRLHCEDHNRIFQTYLCYFNIISHSEKPDEEEKEVEQEKETFYFIKFILKIFLLIYKFVIFKLKKKDILVYFGIKEIHFFDHLLNKIVQFLVEVYQGNYKENYNFLIGDNYEIVKIAVSNRGSALEYASHRLRNTKEIVIIALSKNGFALEFASPELQNNFEIVKIAVEEDGYALEYASPRLQKLLK